jgi:nitrous oxide reductase
MKKQTRRNFIVQTSLSAAVLTTGTGLDVVSRTSTASAASASNSGEAGAALLPAELPGPVVAYVRDLKTGEIAILVGSQEIVYRDSEFVQRLLKALH